MFLKTLFILNAILATESQYVHNYAFPYKPALAKSREMLVANIKVAPDEIHVIKSPNYPHHYMPPIQLGWIASCPDSYVCKLNCTNIDIPCNYDFMEYFSPKVRDADVEEVCGDEPFSYVAPNNKLVIGMEAGVRRSIDKDLPSKFRCEISALKLKPCKCGCIGRTLHKDSDDLLHLQSSHIAPEFSMAAAVIDRDVGRVVCGGVIMSQHYVVTTAQCLEHMQAIDMSVVIGPFFNRGGFLLGAHVIEVTETYVVQTGKPPVSNDLGILELRDNITFNDDVYPACIPVSEKYLVGKSAVMIGWHYINNFAKQLTVYLELLIINRSTCQSYFPLYFDRDDNPPALCTISKYPAHVNAGGPIFLKSESGQIYFIGLSSGHFYASRAPEYHIQIMPITRWLINGAPIKNVLKYYKP